MRTSFPEESLVPLNSNTILESFCGTVYIATRLLAFTEYLSATDFIYLLSGESENAISPVLPRVVSSVGASVTVGRGAGSVVETVSEIGSVAGMVCSSVVGSVVVSVSGSVVLSFVEGIVVLCVLVVVFSDEPQAHKLIKIPKQIITGSIFSYIYHR